VDLLIRAAALAASALPAALPSPTTAAFLPWRTWDTSSRRARTPPRCDEPRTVRHPISSATLAIYSPSLLALTMTTPG